MTDQSNNSTKRVGGIEAALATVKEKSILLARLLALISGPVGLLYASVSAGLIMTAITVVVAGVGLLLGAKVGIFIILAIIWLRCLFWAYSAARRTIKDPERSLKYRNGESIFFKGLVIFFAFVVTLPLIVILLYIIKQGIVQVNWTFLTHIPKPVGETGGGIANALVGSIIVVFFAALIAVPIGILTGIYLSENPHTKLAYYSGVCADILQGVPSIVTGIVIYYWIVIVVGFSAISGSIALAIMMLP